KVVYIKVSKSYFYKGGENMSDNKYIPGELRKNKDGLTEKEFLAQYNPGHYERPSVTVDMLLFGMSSDLKGLKLLLIKRNNHPYIGCYALPGGFVGIKESAYTAACRELEEETGLKDIYMEQLYTMSQPDRDPRMRVIDIAYMTLIPVDGMKPQAGDDASEALWFDITFDDEKLTFSNSEKNINIVYSLKEKVFNNGRLKVKNYIPELVSDEALAFDHAQIVLEGLMRLRNKTEYSDIAFNLMPQEFTLPDLQRVYEIILGKKLYKTNFKRNVDNKIKSLDRKGVSITGNKASELYEYVPD
uniref:NUDIX hydrolase n=3 Tax=Lachnospira sp. TaxID=2049031 RepID=UPI004027BAF7